MTRELDILVGPDGEVRFVHDDDLAVAFADEQTDTRRASHVEPDGKGGWTADMLPVGGPVLGPFARRDEALAAEIAWLKEAMARGEANVR